MRTLAFILALLLFPLVARGYIPPDYTYCQEMLKKADLVVVARLQQTRTVSEKTVLPGSKPAFYVAEFETTFEVLSTLKGKPRKDLVVHYYQYPPARIVLTDTSAKFINFSGKENSCYLLYLTHERGVRFVPVSGQTAGYLSALSVSW